MIDLDAAGDALQAATPDQVICVTARWLRAALSEIAQSRLVGSASAALDLPGPPSMPPVAR